MRMLPFSHFNQQMYSEGSHRSSTSKASTHTSAYINTDVCWHTIPHLYPLTGEVDYSRLWLSGSGSWVDDFVFAVVVTLESHVCTAKKKEKNNLPPSVSLLYIYIKMALCYILLWCWVTILEIVRGSKLERVFESWLKVNHPGFSLANSLPSEAFSKC